MAEDKTKTNPETENTEKATETPVVKRTYTRSKPGVSKTPAKRGRKPKVKTETVEKADAAVSAPETKPVSRRGRKPAVAVGNTPKRTAAAAKKNNAAAVSAQPKPRGRRKKVEVLDKTDTIKKTLWEAIDQTKAAKIEGDIAIQIYADKLESFDSFYFSVKQGQPEIERYHYHGNDGDLILSEEELLKIAAGKYNIVSAVRTGKTKFIGDFSALLKILELF